MFITACVFLFQFYFCLVPVNIYASWIQIKTVQTAQPVFTVIVNQKQNQDFQRQLPMELSTAG